MAKAEFSDKNRPQHALDELKAILLSEDREKIRLLEQELKALRLTLADKEQLLDLLDPLTIELLARRIRQSSGEMASVLAPAVGPAIREQISRAKDDIVDALYPVIGKAIRKAVAEAMKNLARTVNEKLDHALSFRMLRKRIEAKIKGISADEVLLSQILPFTVHEIFYIHKQSGILLAHASTEHGSGPDKDIIGGMLTAIKNFAQDALGSSEGPPQDLNLIEYDDFRIYLENGRYAFLAVVISGVPTEPFYKQIKHLESSLHKAYATHLRSFNGSTQPFAHVAEQLNLFLKRFSPEPEGKTKAPVWLKVAVLILLFAFLGLALRSVWPTADKQPQTPVARHSIAFNRQEIIQQLSKKLPASMHRDLANLHFLFNEHTLFVQGTVSSMAARLLITGTLARISEFPVVVDALTVSHAVRQAIDKINKSAIFFAKGKSDLSPQAKAKLDTLLPYFSLLENRKIKITGYSDSLGSETLNLQISARRAENVKRYLVMHGFEPAQLVTEAKGSDEPLAPNATEQGRARNRRVSFKVTESHNHEQYRSD